MVPARADAECSSSRRRMKPAILVLAAVSLLLPSAVDAVDSLQVRQVAACAPYVTQQHVGYVLLVRVPTDLVGAGSCGQQHSCCYVPCTMPTQQSRPRLPLALVEHAMHAGSPLGTAGTPVGCLSATASVFDWAGGSRLSDTARQLPTPLISHVFPAVVNGYPEMRLAPAALRSASGRTIRIASHSDACSDATCSYRRMLQSVTIRAEPKRFLVIMHASVRQTMDSASDFTTFHKKTDAGRTGLR